MIEVESFPSVEQAANALDTNSRYLGGGTLVMRALNYGEQDFTRIVRSTDPALRQISHSNGKIDIGAGVTMADVIASQELEFLHSVARTVGGPAIRNMATVGGNLFALHPYGDFTTALLALDASVRSASGDEQDLGSFLATREGFSGVVKSVRVSKPGTGEFRFRKVSRVKPKGVAVLSIATWLQQSGGRISAPRIAFGSMGTTPLRAKQTESVFKDKSLDANTIEAACAVVTQDIQPQDDALASAWYRREVAGVHLRRLLTESGGR